MSNRPETSPIAISRQRGYRAVAIGLGLIAGAIVAIPAFLLYRAARPVYLQERGHERTGHRYLFDRTLGWRNIPGWKATTFGKTLTINSRGFRGRECTLQKPAGTRRILVLGDSYAWGYGVDDGEIFTEVLQRQFNRVQPDNHDGSSTWEVLNTGVSGWGTDQQYLFLKTEGFAYTPDVVVLAFFLFNDPVDNVSTVRYGLKKPIFRIRDINPTDDTLILNPEPDWIAGAGGKESGDPIKVTLALLKRLGSLCETKGVPFLIMKFGLHWHRDDLQIVEWNRLIGEQIPRLTNITYLDLDAVYVNEGITVEQLMKGNHDYHWNAFGHDLAGRHLYKTLRATRMIDD